MSSKATRTKGVRIDTSPTHGLGPHTEGMLSSSSSSSVASSLDCRSMRSAESNPSVEDAVGLRESRRSLIEGEWVVKNTFLHFTPSAQALPRRRAATTPGEVEVVCEEGEDAEGWRTANSEEAEELVDSPVGATAAPVAPHPPASLADLTAQRPWSQRGGGRRTAMQLLPPGCFMRDAAPVPSAHAAASASVSSGPSDPRTATINTEADEQFQIAAAGSPSVGSAGHNKGRCKPCAFVWKEEGCENGQECTFCHLCGPNEFQKRKQAKKERVAAARQRKSQRMAASACPAVAESVTVAGHV